MNHERQLERLLDQARGDPEVLAVILFGSRARGEAGPTSDVDVCIVLAPGAVERGSLPRKRLSYTSRVDLDVQLFELLPVYVRRRVLQEGRPLFVRDEDALYDVAFRSARAFEAFKPIYRFCLEEISRARP